MQRNKSSWDEIEYAESLPDIKAGLSKYIWSHHLYWSLNRMHSIDNQSKACYRARFSFCNGTSPCAFKFYSNDDNKNITKIWTWWNCWSYWKRKFRREAKVRDISKPHFVTSFAIIPCITCVKITTAWCSMNVINGIWYESYDSRKWTYVTWRW